MHGLDLGTQRTVAILTQVSSFTTDHRLLAPHTPLTEAAHLVSSPRRKEWGLMPAENLPEGHRLASNGARLWDAPTVAWIAIPMLLHLRKNTGFHHQSEGWVSGSLQP